MINIVWLGSVLYASIAGADSAPNIDIAELEQSIHQQINWERQNHGLAALESDEQLVAIARNHSRDMASQHFFSHVNVQGEDPTVRGKRQGWDMKKQINPKTVVYGLAENIYLTHLFDNVVTRTINGITLKSEHHWQTRDQLVQSIVQGLMGSLPHRKNILSSQFDRQGIGAAISGNEVYVTEDLF